MGILELNQEQVDQDESHNGTKKETDTMVPAGTSRETTTKLKSIFKVAMIGY